MGNHGQKNSKHESVLQSCPSLSHSTVDALGVYESMYMVKKAETYFWGIDDFLRRMLGLE